MDAGGDVTLLIDEKFDFDVSLSPTSAKDHEDCDDEVFIGPVGHTEKCVSAALKSQTSEEKLSPLTTDQAVWSPLSGDKFVEIFKEAHLLALQLESFASEDPKKAEPATPVPNPVVEKFVQESKSKLNLFDAFNEVNKTPVAIKRETYCIQDSPFHQLPPSVQQRFTVSNGKAEPSSGVKSQNCTNPLTVSKLVKSHSSSPLAQKTKAPPQVKSGVPLASNLRTVSKLQPMKAPAVHTKNNHLAIEKQKAVKKTSPARRKNLNSMGSTEDLLSDKSSIASDVSDSSFNTSIVGPSKRTLPVPNKLGLNKVQFKTPSTTTGFRRNTSSSSSSHSSTNASLNSSLSFSPPASNAKLNASLNTSLNTSVTSSRLKPNPNRLALVRPSGVGSSLKNTANLLNVHPKQSTATKPTGNKSTSVSVPQSQTPSGKILRQASAPNLQRLLPPSKTETAVKGMNAKPQARVLPTPTSRLKLPQKQDGLSPDRAVGKNFQPKRLLSCGEIGSGIAQSTPLGATKGMSTNSNIAPRNVSATPNSKHVSALPTPISRRVSGLVTPRTIPRPVSSLRLAAAVQASVKSPVGSTECDQNRTKIDKSPCSPIKEDHAASNAICCSLNFSPESKPVFMAENEEKWAADEKQSEDLLVDIDVDKTNKVRKPSSFDVESQPLIDLSNTPEFNQRLVPLKAANNGQLIDFSSPLIKLSPTGNKENLEYDSPLLKF